MVHTPSSPVDLPPDGSTDLAGAGRRQDQVLEGQLRYRPRLRRPHRPECRCHFAVRQRPHVTHGVPLCAEHRADPVAWVVGPKIHRHGPLQDRADTLAQLPGGGRLLVPDRSQNPDHVRARHLRNRHLPDVREDVSFQASQPEPGMQGGAPARSQLLPDRPGGVREGGHRLGPPLLGPGVAPVAGQLPVRERLLARFLERDEGETAEPELGSAAPDREALDPAPAARGPHVEIESLAVAVASGPVHVADKGRCQSVEGMLPAGLASRGSFGECHTHHYTPIISWIQGDGADQCGTRPDVQSSGKPIINRHL